MNVSPRHVRPLLAVAAVLVGTFGGWTAASAGGGSATINTGLSPAPGLSPRLASPPTTKSELYTGIKPCRIFDTRPSTPMTNSSRNFAVSGTLAGQGGSNTCGIPSYATSVAVNITAISTGSTGYVRGWAYKDTPATATLLNFGPAINVSNQVNIPLCKASCAGLGLTLKSVGSTDLVGDAVGYYTSPVYALVLGDGSAWAGATSGLTGLIRTGTGHYVLAFDRDLKYCTITTTDIYFDLNHEVSADAVDAMNGQVEVEVRDKDDALVDTAFYITATC